VIGSNELLLVWLRCVQKRRQVGVVTELLDAGDQAAGQVARGNEVCIARAARTADVSVS